MKTTVSSRRNFLKFAGVSTVMSGFTLSTSVLASNANPPKLFYTDKGHGQNIMFIHGWTCDSHDWSWQLPFFESKYRTVAIDLRGHGQSEVLPSGSYSPEHYVKDVENLIESIDRNNPWIIVGHSMGGQIGVRVAVKRPDLVKAVVSVDGALGFSEKLHDYFLKVSSDLQQKDPAVVAPPLFEDFYDKSTDEALKRWHVRRLDSLKLHVVRESFPPLFIGDSQAGVGKGSENLCRSLKAPIYHLCRDEKQATKMNTWFRNRKSKADVWRDAGHWIMKDRPDDVNQAIDEWINSL